MAEQKYQYIRTCQECGNKQWDKNPTELKQQQLERYFERACAKCESEALDYGYEDIPASERSLQEE